MSRRATIWGSALLAGAALAFGISRAVRMAWLADDSFVSFRYAWNLVHGHGLVYNAGERVEGYSNLLWTLLMAGGMVIGVVPEVASKALGMLCWLMLVGFLAFRSWRLREHRPFLPLAAALVLLMDDFQTWATGGLETSLYTLLAVVGVLLASESREPRRLIAAGFVLAAAVATRPDGAIFAAVGVAAAWFVNDEATRSHRLALAAFVLGPLILAGAALAWFKLAYYGDLFPTAFYSKSALDPYYGQGLYYVWLFLKKSWFLAPLVAVLVIGSARRWTAVVSRANLVLLAASGLFTVYVAHSGGDFMFARRLIPAMPFLFLVLEDALALLPGRLSKAAVVVLVALGVAVPYPISTR